jgi:hypothetical protein
MNNEEEIDAIQEAMEGRSKSKVINMGDMESIDDKYQLSSEVDKSSNSKKEKDLDTVKREDFLSIYKEGGKAEQAEDDTPDLSNGIKFQRDAEDPDIVLKTGA